MWECVKIVAAKNNSFRYFLKTQISFILLLFIYKYVAVFLDIKLYRIINQGKNE